MAHADWKRCYAVAYDKPPRRFVLWRTRESALFEYGNEKMLHRIGLLDAKPIGIVRIRASKRNPQVQSWLLRNAI